MKRFMSLLKTSQLYSFVAVMLLSLFSVMFSSYQNTQAALSDSARVSFTFDDAYLSTFTNALPTLEKHGIDGTAYIPTGCVGSVGTCRADTDSKYMSWTQVRSLQNTYGWEIGAHTVNHLEISTISNSRLIDEIEKSNKAFADRGIKPTAFASPHGDYSASSLATLAKYYTSHRGFHDTGYNAYPYNDYILRVQQVQMGVSVDQVKAYVDTAKANGQWLILVFHEIQNNPNPDPNEYEYSTSDLDAIASYVKSQNVESTRISDGLISSSQNLVPNSGFNTSLSTSGWSTDDSSRVTRNTSNNGSMPSSTNSVRMVSSTAKTTHLFSPKINVNPNDSYVLKQYVRLASNTAGKDIGFYIDEFDSAGNWVSGQYKGSISWLFPEQKSYVYKPSSPLVSQMQLQIINPVASGITAYIDNVQLFSTATAPVAPPTNLITNGSFDASFTGWNTDTPNLVGFDSTTKGDPVSSPQNSAKLVAGPTSNSHLFSQPVTVTSAKNYQFSIYRNITALSSGELGYYIDEYDINGTWISGQWKGGVYGTGNATNTFSYTPTSSSVRKMSLQVYVTGNSGITAYVDNIRLYEL